MRFLGNKWIRMFKLDKKTVLDLQERNVEKIKIYFYDAWCSGTKVNIIEDFELSNNLEKLDLSSKFDVYIERKDKEKFDGARKREKSLYFFKWKNIG